MSKRMPLESIPTERAVLGSILKDPHALWSVKDRFRPELFVTETHRRIVKVVHDLVEANRDVTISAVVPRMPVDSDGDFSPAGYLAMLAAEDAEPSQMTALLEDLEDMWGRRQMMRLGQELIKQATEDNDLGVVERLDAAKAEIDKVNDPMGSTVRHIADIANAHLGAVNDAYQQEATVGLDIGLKAAQDLIGPLMPGRLYLVAGAPGSGKTAFAQGVAMFVAQTDPVLYEQIEMTGEEMVERDLGARAGISAEKIERASLNDEEMDALFLKAEDYSDLRLYIDASSSVSVSQIRSRAQRLKRVRGLKLIVIDHLLYLSPPEKVRDQFEAIAKNLKALKRLGKDLGVPVVVLSQLRAGLDGKRWDTISRPSVSDLWGGSALEQDVDVILFVHREEYLLRRAEPDSSDKDRGAWEARLEKVEGLAELVLAKRRGGKGTGVRTVYFEGAKTRFSDSKPRNQVYSRDKAQLELDRVAALADE